MAGYPGCSDENVRLAAKYYHLTKRDFSVPFSYSSTCQSVSQCSPTSWSASVQNCIPSCNIPECGYSFSNCDSQCHLPNCSNCNSSVCFHCNSGFYLLYSICVAKCPSGFTVHPLVSDLCFPLDDTSTPESPYILYVTSGRNPSGIGTHSDPYDSLAAALDSLRFNHTVIYLFRGVHKLTATKETTFSNQWSEDLSKKATPAGLNVTLAGYICGDKADFQDCSPTNPVLLFDNLNPVALRLTGSFQIVHIDISADTPLIDNCSQGTCNYCPSIITESAGNGIDDQGGSRLRGTFAPRSVCLPYLSQAFAYVSTNANVTIRELTVSNFRQGFGSWVSLSAANVIVRNVRFVNVTIGCKAVPSVTASAYQPLEAIISQNYPTTEDYLNGTIAVYHSTVELLNNGYEFSASLSYGGFLSAKGIQRISLINSTIADSFSFATMTINVGNALIFEMDSCVFDTVYAGQNLIRIASDFVVNTLKDAVLTHISVTNSRIVRSSTCFSDNTVGSLLQISFSTHLLNVLIENTTISETFSHISAISILNFGNQLPSDKFDSTAIYRTPTSRTVLVFPQKWTRFLCVVFETSVSNGGILVLSGLANLELTNIHVRNSGDYDPDHSMNSKTFQYVLGKPGVYMRKLPLLFPRMNCQRIVTLQRVHNVTISRSSLVSTRCLDSSGTAGIYTTGVMTGNFSLSRLLIKQVYALSASAGICLHISTIDTVVISYLEVRDNVAQTAACVRIISSASTVNSVKASSFVNNFGSGAVLQVVGSYGFEVSNSVFEGNASPTQAGIYFLPVAGLNIAKLTMNSNLFVRNAGSIGTAVYVTNDMSRPTRLVFRLADCSFISNEATVLGSALYIDGSNILTSNSSVLANSTFVSNIADRGTVALAYQVGILSVESCIFQNSSVAEPLTLTGKIGQYVGCIDASFQTNGRSAPSLRVFNCSFVSNQGNAVLRFSSLRENSTLISINNSFIGNRGRPIAIERGMMNDTGSTYLHNEGDCLFITSEAQANISNALIRDNIGYYAGAVYIGGAATGRLKNCIFESNRAMVSAGAIFVEQSALLLVASSVFRRNVATRAGAAIFIFGSMANNTISDSLFEENDSRESGTIGCLSSKLSLARVTLRSNRAQYANGILAFLSEINVTGSRFSNQQSTYASFIHAAIQSFVRLTDCQFEDGAATGAGGALTLISAYLSVTSSNFTNVAAKHGAVLHSEANSTVVFERSRVEGAWASDEQGAVFDLSEGSCYVKDSVFTQFGSGGIRAADFASLVIVNSQFFDGNGTHSAAVYCTDCGALTVSQSVFRNLTAVEGSALFLTAEKGQTSTYIVDENRFEMLVGELSGGIAVRNVDILIENSLFQYSRAVGDSGSGGAIAIQCPHTECRTTVKNCQFIGNSATAQGGSITWKDSQPMLVNNTFDGGVAIYGPNVASFVVSVALSDITGNASVLYIGKDDDHVPILGVIRGIASGQVVTNKILMHLHDHYQQDVSIANGQQASITGRGGETNVLGNVTAQSINGLFVFSGFSITAPPGRSSLIYVSLSSLSSAVPVDNSSYISVFALRVEMRECSIGESQVGIQCVVCPEGKFSLAPDTPCQQCLDEAICYGNFTMVPKAGYWRSSMYSEKFWECPNKDACIGSPQPPKPLSYMGDCATGYYGNLCNGCLSGFSRSNNVECAACPSTIANSVKISGIAVGMLLAFVIIVKTSINSARRPKSHYSIFIKILLNYVQLLMLTASFQLNWPNYMKEMFKIQQSAGNVTEQVFSIDCFLDTNEANSQANTIRMKLLGIAFLPPVLFLGSFLFWLPIAICTRKRSFLMDEMAATNVISFFLVHPSIVKFMFSYLNCRELNPGEFWMESYLTIRCWDYTHYRFAAAVAVPSIVLWGIVTPLLCLLILHQRRNALTNPRMRLRLGFIFTGYQPRKYFWEFIILYRKLLIICVSVFLRNVSVSIQGLTVMVLLLSAFALQIKHKPYIVDTMNQLEIRAVLVAMVTIYSGLYYITSDLEEVSRAVLFALIVGLNGYFLIVWLFCALEAGVAALRSRIPCLNRFLLKYRVDVAERLTGAAASIAMGRGPGEMGEVRDAVPADESELISESRYHRSPGVGGTEGYAVPENSRDLMVSRDLRRRDGGKDWHEGGIWSL